jgi:hypothetical protein
MVEAKGKCCRTLLRLSVLFVLQLRPSRAGNLLAVGDDSVVLCKGKGEFLCQSVDPCGVACGSGKCSNLDDACLGDGVLKDGSACSLRWAHVPVGVEVTFYDLWGQWGSSGADCAESWSCYYWLAAICWQGSQPKETWIGPVSADLEGGRCAVKISIRPGFTCGNCPPDFYRFCAAQRRQRRRLRY